MLYRFLSCVVAVGMTVSLSASYEITEVEALNFVDSVKSIFQYRYAPHQWKKNTYQWDLNQEIENVKQDIRQTPNLTIKSFQRSLKEFFHSTKDYHVGVRYYSTEESSLPFQVKGVNGRYYISYVDKVMLSSDTFSLEVGDELVSFDGHNPEELVKQLQKEITPSANEETDHSLAQRSLTMRQGELGQKVPKGAILVEFITQKTEKPVVYQLMWDYKPEMVFNTELVRYEAPVIPRFFDKEKMKHERALPYFQVAGSNRFDPNELGERVSFLPCLGEPIWSTDSENTFDAYLYYDQNQQVVGYLRIPHFMFRVKQIEEFREIIQVMEEKADILVLDQLNNTGGNLFVLYAFASMLTDKPLVTPKEHILISQDDVMEAYQTLDTLEMIKNDEDAQTFMQDMLAGYPMSYQACLFLKDYCQFIQDQWRQGKLYTDLTHMYGVDYVNPHPKSRFTKPIVMLINELDFSCGDFFPAIMKDNKRAILVGRRTAGAGGYVTYHQLPNRLGVHGFSITGSLGIRSNQQPIENLGVEPDIQNRLIPEDLSNGYQHYISKIHEVVLSLKKPEASPVETDYDQYK